MRVLFDALGLPPYGGARSSAVGWIHSVAVAKEGAAHQFVAVVSRREPDLEGPTNLEQLVAPPLGRFGVRLWAQACLPRIVRARGIDIVHFVKNLGCFLIPGPTVVTINDLNRLHYPAMFSRIDVLYWKTVQRALFSNVDRVIAISETTRRDLVHFYNLPPEKIQVIYPAISPRFRSRNAPADEEISAALQKYGLQAPYILSVGGMAVHKNVYTALRAFCFLLDRGCLADYMFAIVGERFHTHNDERLFDLAAQRKDPRIHFTGIIEDKDLPLIYAGASLFVYPSLYEGFGIAPLEAMACGVPVLASQAGSLPEVLADAAWLVEDATDVGCIAEAMWQLLSDTHIWEQFRERGLANVGRFQWSRTAQQTLELYQEVIGGKSQLPTDCPLPG